MFFCKEKLVTVPVPPCSFPYWRCVIAFRAVVLMDDARFVKTISISQHGEADGQFHELETRAL